MQMLQYRAPATMRGAIARGTAAAAATVVAVPRSNSWRTRYKLGSMSLRRLA